MKTLLPGFALLTLVVAAGAQAETFTFNAELSASNSVPALVNPNNAASGLATLSYDNVTNTYDFTLSGFSLTGPATAAHIHGLANDAQNAGVLVDLMASPFVSFSSGSTLLIGGDDVASPGMIAAGNGHPQQSFLSALNGGLTYINIHTTQFPGGEIRGQLIRNVAAPVPEPEVWASMVAGLGLIGFAVRRRRQA